jgi:hypothetical protein
MIDFPSAPTPGQIYNSVTGGVYSWDGTAWNLTGLGFDKWSMMGIGSWYFVDTSLTGVDVPPQSSTLSTWIELTAALTGAGQFNAGKLRSESVSGSSPLIQAFATIDVPSSPMYNDVIRLINTEERILRPSASPGGVQADAIQGHLHGASASSTGYIVAAAGGGGGTGGGGGWTQVSSTGSPVTDGVNGTPRTAAETRMKNLGVKAYMRIK